MAKRPRETDVVDAMADHRTPSRRISAAQTDADDLLRSVPRSSALTEEVLRERRRSEALLQKEMEASAEVYLKLSKMTAANKQLRDQLAELEENTSKDAAELRRKLSETEAAKADIAKHAEQLSDDLRGTIAEKEFKISQLEAMLENAQGREERGERQVRDDREKLIKVEEELHELQLQLAQSERREMEAKLRAGKSTDSDREVIIRELREELTAGAKDVEQARKLNKQHANAVLLREQLRAAEARASEAETAAAAASDYRVRAEAAEAEVKAFKEALESVPGATDVGSLVELIRSLQWEGASTASREGVSRAALAASNHALETERAKLSSAEAKLASMEQGKKDMDDSLKRAERKVLFLTKERDGLKNILDSLQEDLAREDGGRGGSLTLLATGETRLKDLEGALTESQSQVSELEISLKELRTALGAMDRRAAKAEESCQQAVAEKNALDRELEILAREKGELEGRVASGEFNPDRTKVLHLSASPEMCRLQAENEKLKAELASIQGSLIVTPQQPVPEEGRRGFLSEVKSVGGVDTDVSRSVMADPQTVIALKAQISELEKKAQRRLQIFRDKISLFREACYFLFGYRVDMADSPLSQPTPDRRATPAHGPMKPTFTLRSKFATESTDQLTFVYTPGVGMELIPNEYATSLHQAVDTFVNRWKCIPALTANLTMELFQAETASVG
mmetsp:Transcript_5098/g.18595  ORF Transcript_5098/g.18595 Transcript_5098/m.18595 type:complete len:688 (+) Transcript_5098:300-2363(+)